MAECRFFSDEIIDMFCEKVSIAAACVSDQRCLWGPEKDSAYIEDGS